MTRSKTFRIAVLISGNGSNLQAIIDAFREHKHNIEISVVISNRNDAFGLERARHAGITTECINHRNFMDRDNFDCQLQRSIESYQPDLVVLAGFMRILTPEFVRHFAGKMINIHPSLLPEFRGLHTHQRAIDAKKKEHGVSIHYVTENLDGGPIILQARVPITVNDTVDTLSARVQEKEHKIYPLVIQWIAEGRLSLLHNKVFLDENELTQPLDYESIRHKAPT